MSPQVEAATVAFVGAMIALLVKDVGVQIFLAYQKRKHELEDRTAEHYQLVGQETRADERGRRDVFRLYADPLRLSVVSLQYRLNEILNQPGRAAFLLADAPDTVFNEYKRLSTIYRLAAVLGWIRAFRKERSYLDPLEGYSEGEIEKAIKSLEEALADGPHVEDQRLSEVLRLWNVPPEVHPADAARRALAAELDNILQRSLATHQVGSALSLDESAQVTLCADSAALLSARLNVEIPADLIHAERGRCMIFFGIKEAWIYRDWQTAIGDLMLREVEGAARRYDVIGFGEFEGRYRAALNGDEKSDHLWFNRLGAVFDGLDLTRAGIFDARRNQVRAAYDAIVKLEPALTARINNLRSPTNKLAAPRSNRILPIV